MRGSTRSAPSKFAATTVFTGSSGLSGTVISRTPSSCRSGNRSAGFATKAADLAAVRKPRSLSRRSPKPSCSQQGRRVSAHLSVQDQVRAQRTLRRPVGETQHTPVVFA